jgi:hypothetical protein
MYTNSGIYSIRCNTCNKQYVGQTRRSLKTRFIEHHRHIRTNEPKSAYALHILNNKHEYGPLQSTMELIKSCKKKRMAHEYIRESLYTNILSKTNKIQDRKTPHSSSLPLPLTTHMRSTLCSHPQYNHCITSQYKSQHRTRNNIIQVCHSNYSSFLYIYSLWYRAWYKILRCWYPLIYFYRICSTLLGYSVH